MHKDNLVFINDHRKKSKKQNKETKNKASVLEMDKRRTAVINEERRKVKRTILTEFISAHAVIPKRGLQKVSLYDISSKGLSFDLDAKFGTFSEGEDIAMRVYMNYKTYLPMETKITHVKFLEDEQIYRVGTQIKSGSYNEKALEHFIKFIELANVSLRSDNGDVIVSHINQG